MNGAALVTGAGKRIGRSIALHLADLGMNVAIHYRASADAAEETAEAIRGAGGQAVTVSADLADEQQAAGLLDAAARTLGSVPDVLVNNASCFEQDDVMSTSAESWARHMQVNLRAPFVLSQALARALPAGENANIVNILDQRVWRLTPAFTSYTLSKSALWTLTRTLAQGLAPRIRVNAIGPGPVFPSQQQGAEAFAREASSVPLGRGPAPEEIARAVSFILESPSLTGQMIALDGGQHLAWQTPDVLAGDGE